MRVKCPTCRKIFDDAAAWTVCPHNSLDVAHGAVYCKQHDLYNCYLCIPEKGPAPLSGDGVSYDYRFKEDGTLWCVSKVDREIGLVYLWCINAWGTSHGRVCTVSEFFGRFERLERPIPHDPLKR